jgi:8-oxo-dGTP pyrophosphatase MutT (NUDIX family)
MWLFTTFGFYSIVQKKPSDNFLTVRARAAADLNRLRDRVPQLSATIAGAGTDYPYRATIPHAELALALATITRDIEYPNFKNAAAKEMGHSQTKHLHDVWEVMTSISDDPPPKTPKTTPSSQDTKPSVNSFGGVVIDRKKRLLLREPKNHFGGYVWTFAKGGRDGDETPEETALREVREELGVEAKIIEPIGVFTGDTTRAQFFLMHYVRDISKPSDETAQTRWASLSEARTLIAQTKSTKGRERDLGILEAVASLIDRS